MDKILNTIKNFLKDGKITQFPVKRKLQLCCIYYLADKFEKEREYSEKEVNQLLNEWHNFNDPAVLRRYLCDYGFLLRQKDGSRYRISQTAPSVDDLEIFKMSK